MSKNQKKCTINGCSDPVFERNFETEHAANYHPSVTHVNNGVPGQTGVEIIDWLESLPLIGHRAVNTAAANAIITSDLGRINDLGFSIEQLGDTEETNNGAGGELSITEIRLVGQIASKLSSIADVNMAQLTGDIIKAGTDNNWSSVLSDYGSFWVVSASSRANRAKLTFIDFTAGIMEAFADNMRTFTWRRYGRYLAPDLMAVYRTKRYEKYFMHGTTHSNALGIDPSHWYVSSSLFPAMKKRQMWSPEEVAAFELVLASASTDNASGASSVAAAYLRLAEDEDELDTVEKQRNLRSRLNQKVPRTAGKHRATSSVAPGIPITP